MKPSGLVSILALAAALPALCLGGGLPENRQETAGEYAYFTKAALESADMAGVAGDIDATLGRCAAEFAAAMRVSTDITPYWDRPGQHAEAPNVANVCRNIVHHAYMNGRLWVNDPDTLIVRDGHTELTQSEVELWERAVSLAGGSLLLSDRMATLTPARLALVRRALAEAGAWTNLRPADRWERTLPTIWEAEQGGRVARALFDFDDRHGVREEGC